MTNSQISSCVKKGIVILLLVIALWAPTAWSSASPLDTKVEALKKAMKTEIADKESKRTASGMAIGSGGALSRYPGTVDVFFSNLDEGTGNNNVEALLQQLLPEFSSDAVQKAGHDLLDEFRRERKTKADAYASSVDTIIKRIPNVVLKATKASELDPLLVDLQKAQQAGRGNSGMDQDMQRESQRALSAYQFVAGWQDYLSDSANGKIEQAQNDLRSLAQNNNGESLIPRSDILDRANQLAPSATKGGGAPQSSSETAKQIAEGIQSLDEMAPALQRIKGLPSNPGDYDPGQISATLGRFVKEYDNTKAGLPLAFEFGVPTFQPQFKNPKLYSQLWLFLFEHEFNAFKGPPPTEGESPLQFLERIFTDAEQREDWHELQQAYLARAYIERNSLFSTGTSPHDTRGFELMLAGLNQETAMQYAAAVLSYEQALKAPDTYLPATFIGDRLSKIQKDHPDDYAKGLQLAGLAPVATAPTDSGGPIPPH